MYYCITIYMLEKWPISLSYHHIIFGLGGHVFCLLAEEHCTRWRGKKKSKKRIPSSATSSCTFISQIREQMSGLNLHVPYARHYKPRLIFFFYSIFTSAAAYITDSLCTKNGNSSFFKPKIRGL